MVQREPRDVPCHQGRGYRRAIAHACHRCEKSLTGCTDVSDRSAELASTLPVDRLFPGLEGKTSRGARRSHTMFVARPVLSRLHRVRERRHAPMTDVSTGTVRRKVLIVEDDAPIRELLRLHLALAGFEIEEVGDGTARSSARARSTFDLIVLDVMLPGLDGITMCRAIRSEGANTTTPILMLTARDTEAGQGPRPGKRRRRLSDQAVRHPRIRGAGRRGAAAQGARAAHRRTGASRRRRSRESTLDAERREAVVAASRSS